jgi:peptidyl-prolyl cis-trans isomerase C
MPPPTNLKDVSMRGLILPAAAAATLLAVVPAFAQQPAPARPPAPAAPAPAPAPAANPGAATPPTAAAAPAPADPVLARVDGQEIHASDLAEAAQSLPEELRGMPPQMLYPMLLDQMIDRRALVIAGRKQGLENDPAVQKQVARATDTAIQNTLLSRQIAPTLTDAAIEARYKRDYADKPGEEEVHAAHILVADEDKAKDIIKKLNAGADFAALARENSTDPSAKSNAGDLGFFKKGDMLPEFSDAAFALKPGQITETPVKTRFGWHVIRSIEKRTAPAPALDQVRDEIRQSLIQEGVAKALAQAKQGLTIQKFNPDGSPITDSPAAGTTAPGATPAAPR